MRCCWPANCCAIHTGLCTLLMYWETMWPGRFSMPEQRCNDATITAIYALMTGDCYRVAGDPGRAEYARSHAICPWRNETRVWWDRPGEGFARSVWPVHGRPGRLD